MKFYHVSSPSNREAILSNGLLPMVGPRRCFGNEDQPPGIFLSKLEPFDSTFDDDIYEVEYNIDMLHVDTAMLDAYFTTASIPITCLKLVYKGSGKDLLLM